MNSSFDSFLLFLEQNPLLKVWSIILASLCYTHFIVTKLPIGLIRLISLLPIFTLFTILPLSLSSSVLQSGITSFFITWLANFKLLLFSFNQGPLSNNNNPNSTLLNFILIAAFPIKIKHQSSNPKNPTKIPFLNFYSKTLITSILVGLCHNYGSKLPPFIVFVIYSCLLYLVIDIIMGICNKLVGSILGVDLFSPSDEPYLAKSLQDFWGHRWNLVVTDALRHTVYKPMRVFLSFWFGQMWWAHVVGVITAFTVSGLMHELIFYYMTRVSPTWEVTLFFVLHGVCVVLEGALKRVLGPKLGLHWGVSGPLAVGFVMWTGKLLFFGPLVRNRVDVRAIEESVIMYELVKGLFKL